MASVPPSAPPSDPGRSVDRSVGGDPQKYWDDMVKANPGQGNEYVPAPYRHPPASPAT